MKKIKYIIGIVIAGAMMSCSDYLEAPTKSSLDESVIFSTPDLAKGAVDGIKIPFGETNSYRGRFLPWYGMNTDIEWYNSSEKVGDGSADLAVYFATPSNSNMNTTNNAWAQMYSGIERANICIRGLRAYGNPEPGTELGYLLGESLTLRAVIYADLLRAWGDVVARFEPINSETMYLPKTNRDEIYKQLIADLEEASTLVPWPNETSNTASIERVNKAFVKGLRARLCMVASGYSQYPDGIRRSTDPELTVAKMYPIAYQECLDIINSGTCKLETSFETVFKKNCQDNVAAGGEGLWEIPFSDGRGRMLFTFAIKHNSIDQYTGQARGGSAGPVPYLFYDYDVKDTRRDVTVVPYEWGKAVNGISQQVLLSLNKWSFGKFRYEWMNRIVTSTNDDGVNKQYMRYAEVIMMAAETANELQGPSAAAPYLKMIRQRAFPSGVWAAKVDAYVNALTTKDAMLKAIVEEHKFEFCGEMVRKEALIRWNLLKTKLDEAKTKMYALRDRSGAYSDVPEKLYYKYASNGESLVIYGLNRGETADKSSEYEYNVSFVAPSKLVDSKIEAIYARNPDQWQFWPIWQVFLDASNGQLVNDYGY
ncbi:MAG: carbohydrate-binding protein SusD [Bacteroidetes bacterium GWF2_42_66]|nr:MAG: carbohydrate-binding protein SusD [Bacteroidetes bacterium GWA2_42_15]OFY02617.1 MAG: carbohydrate-binding protein SusD [Bacteroidetes bacterium GWE2_42_39]OFY41283.1 MAG: carbohydrate-binding protein SusD [Bacteroidetes bacterium GWF2_42_66]HBL75526.1 RagB/SusD family nutrient uptake outer membrane protein [Prolixibacteraceae bacterium]HCR89704.1 RagB/SusD family nutrient uptake outer membrane protein [Prolixibacteraceae bacterium]